MGAIDRLKHAWNAFVNLDDREWAWNTSGASYGSRPDRVRHSFTNDKTIVTSIYNRIAIDVAMVVMNHVRTDDQDRFSEIVDSGLNNCLKVEANVDQAATAFRVDWVMSLFAEGVIAVVPVDTTKNPNDFGSFDIKTMRVGKIVQWMPEHVRVQLYNEQTGRHEEVTVAKQFTSITENPMHSVMNEPSSTLQRLVRKLNLLDIVDEASSSGKLDLIIQLPYTVKSESKRLQAEQRRKDIEFQLKGSKYGIAYTDGVEKITQLNRPSENNLLKQVEFLTNLLYGQLGITSKVMDGTADEAEMLNYYNRTVLPILTAMTESMRRTFLTKTARTQGQSIMFFRNAFALVPMEKLAELIDKLTRNEILTSNEVRGILGFKPVKDKKADELINPNMPVGKATLDPSAPPIKAVAERMDVPGKRPALTAPSAQVEPPS